LTNGFSIHESGRQKDKLYTALGTFVYYFFVLKTAPEYHINDVHRYDEFFPERFPAQSTGQEAVLIYNKQTSTASISCSKSLEIELLNREHVRLRIMVIRLH
jgi:hypothetical protein